MRADTPPPGLAGAFATDWSFDALGTVWTLTTDTAITPGDRGAVTAELDRLDRFWSRFRDDSVVADMARRPGRFPIDDADQPLLDWYRALYTATGGAVSPLVGQTVADAGYDAGYSLTPASTIAATPHWADVIEGHDGALTLRRPALLDVGAAGKGFAVDRVAGVLSASHTEFVVDGSGDLLVSGRRRPLRVALEHPLDTTQAIGVAAFTSGSLCASAANRRAWGEWHHIVDPRTSRPADDVLATWAYAPTALLADGLATALFFSRPDALRDALAAAGAEVDFGYVVLRRDGRADYAGVPGLELFT
ncbi:MAG: FAD:protein FMN transferase [Gordonia sp. (in: high G+C Gram-positive bacteria)]